MGSVPVGICLHCQHLKVVSNRRGSSFFLCQKSQEDTRFPRYPGIPVLACAGFQPHSPDSPRDSDNEEEV